MFECFPGNLLGKNMRLLRLPEVMNITGLPRSSLYQAVRLGTFPRPIQLGARTVAWTSDAVGAWLSQKANGAGAENP
jgi:prophage regulatory protein